jgi:hypothetical protein
MLVPGAAQHASLLRVVVRSARASRCTASGKRGKVAADDYVGHGLGGVNDVAVNEISVIALRLRAP